MVSYTFEGEQSPSINCASIRFVRLKPQSQIKAEIIGPFFSAELLAQFIFHLFLLSLKRKRVKINCPRSSAKKNRPNVTSRDSANTWIAKLLDKALIDLSFNKLLC
ncbi:hypothetical protein ALC57_08229 [Trachymyrmex cornetzi]|uniref:Uncharacterized protein n=1 Tax=Trachymyrmex cornetzi TaxID=471704 RepID=A0A195E3G0_9HYME|nr:hypothetical protein ALC57_08229 [Trachymyrmex cornetzi]